MRYGTGGRGINRPEGSMKGVFIQGVPGGMDKTSGGCSLC